MRIERGPTEQITSLWIVIDSDQGFVEEFVYLLRDIDHKKDGATNSGTKRIQSKVIAPTDGEQFLKLDRGENLLRIQIVCNWVMRWFRSEKEHEEESEVIIYPHLSELFAIQNYAIRNAINKTKILLQIASWKFRKRSCKKSFDHYNAIPSLNDWLPRQVLISDLIFDSTEG